MGMALLDEKLSAETAAQWGLIWASIDDNLLLLEAQKIAQRFKAKEVQALVVLELGKIRITMSVRVFRPQCQPPTEPIPRL